jgi:hypothetical protein
VQRSVPAIVSPFLKKVHFHRRKNAIHSVLFNGLCALCSDMIVASCTSLQ